MPTVGEIISGKKLGYKGRSAKIWIACEGCGKERWVNFIKGKPKWDLCRKCSGKTRNFNKGVLSFAWKGGRTRHTQGYIQVFLLESDFFFPMVNHSHYVFEHRLVMAKHLGRCLHNWELVHHRNGVKTDNRIENLELLTQDNHIIEHNKGYQDGYVKGLYDSHTQRIKSLEARVTLLEAENELLKAGIIQPTPTILVKGLDKNGKK